MKQLYWHRWGKLDRERYNALRDAGAEQVELVTRHWWSGEKHPVYGDMVGGWWLLDADKFAARAATLPSNYSGWLVLDIENAYHKPWRFPDDERYTWSMAVDSFLLQVDLIGRLRMLLPLAKLSIYNLASAMTPEEHPRRWALLLGLHELVDGISPDVYRHGWIEFDDDVETVRELRTRSSRLIADRLGIALHHWTWHQVHRGDDHTDEQSRAWHRHWTECDGWMMFSVNKAPVWFIEQQGAMLDA